MAMSLASITAWLKSKNITAHSVAVAAIFISTAIVEDQQVRDFILKLFQVHPKVGTSIVALAMIVLKYSHSSSAAGAVVAAKEVMASPTPPTREQIQAATPPAKVG
jgi:hypothetical protein